VTTRRVDASAAVQGGVDREPPERQLAPRVRVVCTSVRHDTNEPREGWSSGHPTGGGSGEPGAEPHGREWMKDSTGSEEAKAVKVVRNGEGGPERDWTPATRYGGTTGARAEVGRPGPDLR